MLVTTRGPRTHVTPSPSLFPIRDRCRHGVVAGSRKHPRPGHHITHLQHPSPPPLQPATYNRTNADHDRGHGHTHEERSETPFGIPGATGGFLNIRKVSGFAGVPTFTNPDWRHPQV